MKAHALTCSSCKSSNVTVHGKKVGKMTQNAQLIHTHSLSPTHTHSLAHSLSLTFTPRSSEHLMCLQVQHQAATTVQAAVRGFLLRKQLARRHQTASVQQATFKECAHRTAAVLDQAATRIQSSWKGLLQRRRWPSQRFAATIQAACRGHQQRLILAQQHSAAVKLQAYRRGSQARQLLAVKRRAAVRMQAAF